MRLERSWSDLETRGYAVLRGFLSAEEVRGHQDAFRAAPKRSWKKTLYSIDLPRAVETPLRERAGTLLPEITAATAIRVNFVKTGALYFPTASPKLGDRPTRRVMHEWHSDRISYYMHQTHYHYLNFWIPIVKPEAGRSGLAVIPMDRLAESAPRIQQAIEGRGAASIRNGRLAYEIDERSYEQACPFDPEALAVAPELDEGDALVMRGDVLHRTQDTETYRVAISLRAFDADRPLSRQTLLTLSAGKLQRMRLAPVPFSTLIASFWYWRAPEITGRQWEELRARLRRGNPRALACLLAALASYRMLLRRHYGKGRR